MDVPSLAPMFWKVGNCTLKKKSRFLAFLKNVRRSGNLRAAFPQGHTSRSLLPPLGRICLFSLSQSHHSLLPAQPTVLANSTHLPWLPFALRTAFTNFEAWSNLCSQFFSDRLFEKEGTSLFLIALIEIHRCTLKEHDQGPAPPPWECYYYHCH